MTVTNSGVSPVANAPMRPTRIAIVLLICILCTMIAIVAGRIVYGLLIPTMLPFLRLDYTQGSQLGAASALGYLIGIVPVGVFAARFGERTAVLVGLCLSALAHGAMAGASAFSWLLLVMFFLGMGSAFIYTPLFVLLGNLFPNRRGAALSVAGSGIGVGMLIAGVLVPIVVMSDNEGWRLVWLALSGMAGLTFLAVLAVLPDRSFQAQSQVRLRTQGAFREIWNDPFLRSTAVMYAAIGIAFTAHNLFMYSYALESGLSDRLAGGLVATAGMLSIFAGPVLGQISDRMDRALILHVAVLITAAATILVVVLPSNMAFSIYFIVSGLISLGMPPLVIAVTTIYAQRGNLPPSMATSFVTLFYALGQFLSPALVSGAKGSEGNLKWIFLSVSVILCVAVLPSIHVWRRSRLHQMRRGKSTIV